MLKQGEHVLPQAKRVLALLSNANKTLPRSVGGPISPAKEELTYSPIPYLMITNGGGVTEAHRRTALSKNFDVKVSRLLAVTYASLARTSLSSLTHL